jgi:hypothetical protein
MTNVRTATLRSRRRTSRREEQLREMNIRCVPVTKYDVRRVHMPGGWFLVERVTRRTGIPYVTLYDYPKRQPIRLAKGKKNVVIFFFTRKTTTLFDFIFWSEMRENCPCIFAREDFTKCHVYFARLISNRGTLDPFRNWENVGRRIRGDVGTFVTRINPNYVTFELFFVNATISHIDSQRTWRPFEWESENKIRYRIGLVLTPVANFRTTCPAFAQRKR